MMPGGHLATSIALGGAVYAATGSPEAVAGCFAGGFLIDVDHYLDYLIFEKQWRRPGPRSFLSYYFRLSPRKLVLPLHSIELMTILLAVSVFHPAPLLVGYWFGAAMHMTFDVLINGECALKRAFLFYFFSYRASKQFAATNLMDNVVVSDEAGRRPVRYFFTWRPPEKKEAPIEQIESV
jgi:hypothetical protein